MDDLEAGTFKKCSTTLGNPFCLVGPFRGIYTTAVSMSNRYKKGREKSGFFLGTRGKGLNFGG